MAIPSKVPTAEPWALGVGRSSPLFVAGLVELDLEVAGDFEMGNQPVSLIGDVAGEFDAALFQLRHRLLNVIAVKRNVVSA